MNIFQQQIKQGIPDELPRLKDYDNSINHAPKRKDILSKQEKGTTFKSS